MHRSMRSQPATSEASDAGSVRSETTPVPRPPAASTSAATRSMSARVRAATTTRHPWAAKCTAIARPSVRAPTISSVGAPPPPDGPFSAGLSSRSVLVIGRSLHGATAPGRVWEPSEGSHDDIRTACEIRPSSGPRTSCPERESPCAPIVENSVTAPITTAPAASESETIESLRVRLARSLSVVALAGNLLRADSRSFDSLRASRPNATAPPASRPVVTHPATRHPELSLGTMACG